MYCTTVYPLKPGVIGAYSVLEEKTLFSPNSGLFGVSLGFETYSGFGEKNCAPSIKTLRQYVQNPERLSSFPGQNLDKTSTLAGFQKVWVLENLAFRCPGLEGYTVQCYNLDSMFSIMEQHAILHIVLILNVIRIVTYFVCNENITTSKYTYSFGL